MLEDKVNQKNRKAKINWLMFILSICSQFEMKNNGIYYSVYMDNMARYHFVVALSWPAVKMVDTQNITTLKVNGKIPFYF